MNSLQDDGIFTSTDEEFPNGLGEELFETGAGDPDTNIGAPETSDEDEPEQF